MPKVIVQCLAVSVDGFAAGHSQDLDHPLGVNGPEIFEWFFQTRTWRAMHGLEGGETGIDDSFATKGMSGKGAWILGRNMFGPIRGPWPDEKWRGWWGDEPPYHVSAFVLTHHERDPLEMKGGTTFYFITDGIHAALEKAREAAGDLNIRVGGGPATIRQYLLAGLIDEVHLAFSPVLLGSGEPLFNGLDLRKMGYECKDSVPGERATHIIIGKVT